MMDLMVEAESGGPTKKLWEDLEEWLLFTRVEIWVGLEEISLEDLGKEGELSRRKWDKMGKEMEEEIKDREVKGSLSILILKKK